MKKSSREKRVFESKVLCMAGRPIVTSQVETYPSEVYPNGSTYGFHDFYEMEFFFIGNGEIFINGVSYAVQEGFCYLLRPGDCHRYRLDEEHWASFRNLKLSEEMLNSVLIQRLSRIQGPCAAVLSDSEQQMMRSELELLDRFLHQENGELMIRNIVDRMVILLLQHISGLQEDRMSRNDPVTLITDYVGEHYAESIRQSDAARLLSQSESYFGSYFKRKTGLCFSEYLRRVRLEHAQRLLKTTVLSVKEIAYATGFHSQEYFSRVFCSALGQTPIQYRKEAEENDGA